ncbi:MAG: hypothetical protein AAGM22_21865 [Acidobacteriota bacterium]
MSIQSFHSLSSSAEDSVHRACLALRGSDLKTLNGPTFMAWWQWKEHESDPSPDELG